MDIQEHSADSTADARLESLALSTGKAARGELPQKHTIAVVIALYDGEQFIREALGSVLAQSRQPDEIIVVDDGSTDQGPKIVAEMAMRAPIMLISKPNGGQSSARNFGIGLAKSSLIALLDQDDVWYRRHLEALEQPFLVHPDADRIGWVHSDLDEIDEKGAMMQHRLLATIGKACPKTSLCQCVGSDLFILPSASLFLKSAFNSVGGFDERLSGYEDDDFFLQLFLARYLNVFLDESFSAWRMHDSSSSQSPRMARSRMVYAEKLFQVCSDKRTGWRGLESTWIAPRFIRTVINDELFPAVKKTNYAALYPTIADIQSLVSHIPKRQRRRMTTALNILKFALACNSKYLINFAIRKVRRAIKVK